MSGKKREMRVRMNKGGYSCEECEECDIIKDVRNIINSVKYIGVLERLCGV